MGSGSGSVSPAAEPALVVLRIETRTALAVFRAVVVRFATHQTQLVFADSVARTVTVGKAVVVRDFTTEDGRHTRKKQDTTIHGTTAAVSHGTNATISPEPEPMK